MENIQNNPFGWVEIYVDDIERAQRFYETVFQISLTDMEVPTEDGLQMKSFAFNEQGYGASGALVKMEGFGPGIGGTLVYFSSADCAIEESRVEAAGGQVAQSKTGIGEHGYIAILMDSEGNMIGLHSMQ